MLSSATDQSMESTGHDPQRKNAPAFLTRKIWLPKSLYTLLPYFYVGAGMLAFLATIYISDWFWVVPHYVLFSAGCVHLGISVYRRRSKHDETATAEN